MLNIILIGYGLMALSTFIAAYDFGCGDYSTITKVIGSGIIAVLWPVTITSKLLQKLFH